MGLIIADLRQGLVAVRNHGRAFVGAHRVNGLHHVRDHIGVLYHNLIGLVASQIRKLLQHLIRGMQVQRSLIIRILKASPCHDDTAVDLILRIKEMYVAGGNHRLVELLSQLHDPFVDVLDVLKGMYVSYPLRRNHEFVVAHRLNLQIVIEIYDSGYLHIALSVQQSSIKLSRLACAAQNQPLPVLLHQTLGQSGMPAMIVSQMGLGHNPIEIDSAQIIFCQNDGMVGGKLLCQLHIGLSQCVQLG